MKLAVITAAYRAQKYIGDMIRSFNEQHPLEGWTYELRIGVDGCPDTCVELDRLRVPYWFSDRNVGAYVIRNSLILLDHADIYTVFDSDDVMKPDYLKRSIGNMGGFRSERVGSDTDFQRRAEALGIAPSIVRDCGFMRRNHAQSLTHDKQTGQGSAMRSEIISRHRAARAGKQYKVKPETVTLTRSEP